MKEIIICNIEINYPDILPQEKQAKHLSLPCNGRIKIDVNVYNNTIKNDNNSWQCNNAYSVHITPLLRWHITQWSTSLWYLRAKFENVIIGQFSNCRADTLQSFGVFLYHDSFMNTFKTICIRIGHVIRRSGIKYCICKWRHRTNRQPKTTLQTISLQ